ncbi:MAG: NUDIX domain-containing protein [Synechococcales cyanobacterium RM1_1_8]|nr:NUDIX domain-containing protein [Synechococcales cyanobacterium RM1_1_8]
MALVSVRFCPACGSDGFGAIDGEALHPKEYRCDRCGFVYFHNVTVAAAAILEAEGQVLMVVRAKEPAQGKLDLPGGFVDPGETAEQALLRELEEELGLQLSVPHRYLCSSVNDYPYGGVMYHSLDLFYLVRLAEKPVLNPADDVAGYLWCELDAIAAEAIAFQSVRDALQAYGDGLKDLETET